MSNWAIVIGINDYLIGNNLSLAVNDALDMTQWLLDKNGGNVPPCNLYLLTRPAAPTTFADNTLLPTEIVRKDATFDNLISVIYDLKDKSGAKGDRFYFYFSGHGLINTENFINQQGLAMADFETQRFDRAITLNSIVGFLSTFRFSEQFFIIDACRNITWKDKYRLGNFPEIGEANENFTSPQYFLFATAPLLRAREKEQNNDRNSVFTKILLEGLKGRETAKFYHYGDKKYYVTLESLTNYLTIRFNEKKIPVSMSNPQGFQSPRIGSSESEGKMVIMAEFDKNAFFAEKLDIYVSPPNIWKEVQILVTSYDIDYYTIISPVVNSPLDLSQNPQPLFPKSYNVKAFAKGYTPRVTPSDSFDLYEPKSVLVDFYPDESGEQSEIPPWIKTRGSRLTADLTVKSADSLAPLEIRNIDNELLTFGQGKITLFNQKPGLYRVRLVLPENEFSEDIINLRGENKEINLDAPPFPDSSLFNELIKHTTFEISEKNNLLIPQDSEPIATARLITILTSAESFLAAPFVDGHYGQPLSGVRVILLQEETSFGNSIEQSVLFLPNADIEENSSRSPQIRFGKGPIPKTQPKSEMSDVSRLDQSNGPNQIAESEQTPPANLLFNYLSQVRITLQSQFGTPVEFPLNPSLSSNIAGLAKYELRAFPGNYFLSVKLPDRNITRFSVSVFPDQLTSLILHRQPNGELNVFGFSPAADVENYPKILKENVEQLRRMELLQRFHINNCVDATHALHYADEILKVKKIDPLAESLAAYTKLLLNRAEELEEVTERLTRTYQYFSDGHIMRAEYLASQGAPDELIISHYYNALSQGIPIFAEGVKKLVQGFKKYEIEHPYENNLYTVSNNCAENILWTLFDPFFSG